MQPIRGKGADCAKHAEHKNGEENCLVSLPALIGQLLYVAQNGVLPLRFKGWPRSVERVHDGRGQHHLGDCVRQTGHTGGLAEKVAPSDDPRPGGNVFGRHNVFGDIVHSSGGWIC